VDVTLEEIKKLRIIDRELAKAAMEKPAVLTSKPGSIDEESIEEKTLS